MGMDLESVEKNSNGEYEKFRSSIWTWSIYVGLMERANVLNEFELAGLRCNSGWRIWDFRCRLLAERMSKFLNDNQNLMKFTTRETIPAEHVGRDFVTVLQNNGFSVTTTNDSFIPREWVENFILYLDKCSLLGGFRVW